MLNIHAIYSHVGHAISFIINREKAHVTPSVVKLKTFSTAFMLKVNFLQPTNGCHVFSIKRECALYLFILYLFIYCLYYRNRLLLN